MILMRFLFISVYWAGAAVVLMCLRSMRHELLWGRCGSDLLGRSCCGAHGYQIFGAGAVVGHMSVDLCGRSCCGADVGQIYGVGAAMELLWVRSMGQDLLWVICGSDL